MFEKRIISTNTSLSCIRDADLNETYTLRPVLICNRHDVNSKESMYFQLSYKPQHTLSYMEQYCRYYKCETGRSLVELRYFEQLRTLSNEKGLHEPVTDPKVHILPIERICSYCHTNRSLYWYEGNICHSCNLRSDVQESDSDGANPKAANSKGIPTKCAQRLMEGIKPAMFNINISETNVDEKKAHRPSQ